MTVGLKTLLGASTTTIWPIKIVRGQVLVGKSRRFLGKTAARRRGRRGPDGRVAILAGRPLRGTHDGGSAKEGRIFCRQIGCVGSVTQGAVRRGTTGIVLLP